MDARSVIIFATLLIVVESSVTVNVGVSCESWCKRRDCDIAITDQQRYLIEEYEASLANLSSEVMEAMVYNRTTPVMELTEDQQTRLLATYPEYFVDTRNGSSSQRRRRDVSSSRICEGTLTTQTHDILISALDIRRKTVVLVQGLLEQTFEEDQCVPQTSCAGGVTPCSCKEEYRQVTAIVASRFSDIFEPEPILLHACVAKTP
ncbi:uncharacterized protein [Antedon mediterranea]|uniref:uncharacterized protein n=1 Tax=Antedon mediterranea TaxID=105859 RepID=UPI003AF775B1